MGKVRSSLASVVFIGLTLSFFVACLSPHLYKTPAKGVYHLVKKNETPEVIARAYNISYYDLVRANKIKDIRSIREGSIVFVPSAKKVIDIGRNVESESRGGRPSSEAIFADRKASGKKETKTSGKVSSEADHKGTSQKQKYPETKKEGNVIADKTSSGKPLADRNIVSESRLVPEQKRQAGRNSFIWPVRGAVKSPFGNQPNKTFYNWIKIISPRGTKIKAAESGVVIFSSNLKNYGETIILRHQDGYATVYTHLKKRYVIIDKNVKKGETIASLGERDEEGDIYMNFEIRLHGKAQNPLLFLP